VADAKLDLGLAKRGLNGIGKSLQTIDAGDQNNLTTALQFCQYVKPELRTLIS
jgi:hypothetical protein